MNMSPNLSIQQMKMQPSVAKHGAMPYKPKFDGPAPIKENTQQGVMQPNKGILLPKPGFF